MKVHGKRTMLNGPGFQSTAAIVAEIEDTSGWREGRNGDGEKISGRWNAVPHSRLCISDCQRSIEFLLDVDTAADWRNSIRKVEAMIDALERLHAGMLTERDRFMARTKGLSK